MVQQCSEFIRMQVIGSTEADFMNSKCRDVCRKLMKCLISLSHVFHRSTLFNADRKTVISFNFRSVTSVFDALCGRLEAVLALCCTSGQFFNHVNFIQSCPKSTEQDWQVYCTLHDQAG